MFCTHCGAELPEGACFCPVCGRSAEPAAPQKIDSEQPPTIQEQIAPPPHYDDLDEIDPFDEEPPRRPIGMLVSIFAAVIIVVAVVIALVKVHPWTLLADMDHPAGVVSSEESDADNRPTDEDAGLTDADDVPAQTTDWRDYDGAWEADGLIFALEMLDGEVNVTLHSLDNTYWDAAEPEGDTVDVRLRGMEIRLKAGKDRALRIAIDGKPFEAVRYTGRLDTKSDPPAAMTGSSYLYYSASTGTRSTDDVIPNDRSLHFWPLDQFAIAASDLDRLTQNEIDIIRNEAFARHGYIFTTDAWQTFFSRMDWYTPDPKFTEARFSKLEKQNIDTIMAYEKARGWL